MGCDESVPALVRRVLERCSGRFRGPFGEEPRLRMCWRNAEVNVAEKQGSWDVLEVKSRKEEVKEDGFDSYFSMIM